MSNNLTSSYNLSVGNSLIIAGNITQNENTANTLGSITTSTINSTSITTDAITTNSLNVLTDTTLNNLTVNGSTTLLKNIDLTLFSTSFYDINLQNSIKFTLNGVSYTLTLTELKKIFSLASTSYVDSSISTAINNLLGGNLDVNYNTLLEIQTMLKADEANITTLLSAVSTKATLTEVQANANTFTNENIFNNNVFINSNLVVNNENVISKINANVTQTNNNTTQITSNTTQISSNIGQINVLDSKIVDIDALLTTYSSNFNTIDNTIQANGVNINQNSSDINILSGTYKNLETITTGQSYDLTNDLTTFDNDVLITKNLNVSGSINNVLNNTFGYLVNVSQDVQASLTDFTQRLTDVTFDSVNNNTNINGNLVVSGNINGLNSAIYGYINTLTENVQNAITDFRTRLTNITFVGTVTEITQNLSVFGNTIFNGNIQLNGTFNTILTSSFTYLKNVTSDIQAQLNSNKAEIDDIYSKINVYAFLVDGDVTTHIYSNYRPYFCSMNQMGNIEKGTDDGWIIFKYTKLWLYTGDNYGGTMHVVENAGQTTTFRSSQSIYSGINQIRSLRIFYKGTEIKIPGLS